MSQEEFLLEHWLYWLWLAVSYTDDLEGCLRMADRYYILLQEVRNGGTKSAENAQGQDRPHPRGAVEASAGAEKTRPEGGE